MYFGINKYQQNDDCKRLGGIVDTDMTYHIKFELDISAMVYRDTLLFIMFYQPEANIEKRKQRILHQQQKRLEDLEKKRQKLDEENSKKKMENM